MDDFETDTDEFWENEDFEDARDADLWNAAYALMEERELGL